MSFFFFFHPRKPRPFEHKPIYFDPQKEIFQSVKEKENKPSPIKGRFVEGTTHLKKRLRKKKSN
ncbi:MAG: hypothetical protein FWF52_03935 [Candidatus Azobacteroides sp.]|nr:hypothetical protein [Candidatus Azobacteroides sp.]